MHAWSFVSDYPGLPSWSVTDSIFSNAGGYAMRGAGAFEAMSDHQLRDIGLIRCGSGAVYQPPLLGHQVVARTRKVSVESILSVFTAWRTRAASLKAATISSDQLRSRIGMVRADVD